MISMAEKIIQWFPGHMAKTMRQIREKLPLVDIVIEVLDARAPFSTVNPSLEELIGSKPLLYVLNKSDMSDPKYNEIFLKELNNKHKTVLLDSLNGKKNIKIIEEAVNEVLKEKIDKAKKEGRSIYPIKAVVVGIPNSGKSTFMNNLAKRSVLSTGDRPGVTKSQQYLKASNNLLLLDNPGILWPKFENQEQAKLLALIGSIKDEIVPVNVVAEFGVEILKRLYPEELKERYNLTELKDIPDIMNEIGRRRGCIVKGGEINLDRTYDIFLRDLRSGRIGRLTFERPS